MRGLRVAIPPGRIDSSYMASLGLTGQKKLTIINALRFLRLVDSEDRPTAVLVQLVESSGDEYKQHLRNIILEAYSQLFNEVDIEKKATQNQLDDYFRKRGAKGSVVRKSSSFFINLAREADMKLSPHVFGIRLKGQRAPRGKQAQRPVPNTPDSTGQESSWREMLISRFPPLDVGWSEELKKEWFASFRELIRTLGSI